jgi:hypothetical protein
MFHGTGTVGSCPSAKATSSSGFRAEIEVSLAEDDELRRSDCRGRCSKAETAARPCSKGLKLMDSHVLPPIRRVRVDQSFEGGGNCGRGLSIRHGCSERNYSVWHWIYLMKGEDTAVSNVRVGELRTVERTCQSVSIAQCRFCITDVLFLHQAGRAPRHA